MTRLDRNGSIIILVRKRPKATPKMKRGRNPIDMRRSVVLSFFVRADFMNIND